MLVSAFLAATALAQNVGGAMGYERTAVMFVEPDTATLAVVETSRRVHPRRLQTTALRRVYDEATAQLAGMIAGAGGAGQPPGGVLRGRLGRRHRPDQAGAGVGDRPDVSVPEEPETALARGAALASANAPLFASSTAALAYAQDPGTGAVDQHALPEYLRALRAGARRRRAGLQRGARRGHRLADRRHREALHARRKPTAAQARPADR